jgi:hypothetical protein
VATVDEPLSDLRRDEPLALEDADRVASQPHQHRAREMVLGDLLEQRTDPDDVVLACVAKRKRRRDDERLVRRLEARRAVRVDRAPRRPVERREALGRVRPPDEPAHSPEARRR